MASAQLPHPLRALLGALLLLGAALPRAAAAQDLVCDSGDREVRRLEFVGNRAFSDAELAYAVATTPSEALRRWTRILGERRCLDQDELSRDMLRIPLFYRKHGYYGVTVDTQLVAVGRQAVVVRFLIQEGEPIVIGSLKVTGIRPPADSGQLVRGLRLEPGRRFDRVELTAARDTMIRRLRNVGFPGAEVLLNFSANEVRRTADVELNVVQGPLTRIGAVDIAVTPLDGKTQQIPDRAVRRLLGLRTGRVYRDRDLAAAQRSLYETDAYQHVDVRLVRDSGVTGADSLATVRVSLVEGNMHAARLGGGWGQLDCFRAQGEYTDFNAFRSAQRVTFTGRVSKIGMGWPFNNAEWACTRRARADDFADTLNYYVSTTFRPPALFGLRAVPTITLYRERRSEYMAYLRVTDIGGIASYTSTWRRIPLTFTYELASGRTQAQDAQFCAVFNQCTPAELDFVKEKRPLAVAGLALVRDRTDDPVSPTAGSVLRFEGRHASRWIGSDSTLQFNKAVLDFAWFRRLGGENVLALRLRGGRVIGQGILFQGEENDFIPPQERLYAGGATTVRGFAQNALGPVVYRVSGDATLLRLEMSSEENCSATATACRWVAPDSARLDPVVPLGGNALAVANLEYRIRSPILPRLLQWTVFTDAGNVWTPGAGEDEFKIYWTPGAGVRIFSPVGAIRVDVGYLPKQFDRVAGRAYYVTEGNQLFCVSPGNRLAVRTNPTTKTPEQEQGACPTDFVPRTETFSRFTFNFSIGQAF